MAARRVQRRALALSLVLLATIAVKGAYLVERSAHPDLRHPAMDAAFHDEWAAGLAFDSWSPRLEPLRREPYFRAPLYPYLVSVVYRVSGRDPLPVLALQVALSAVSACLLFVLAGRLYGRAAAWAAAFLFVAYWPMTYFDGELLTPSLEILLAIALALVLLVAHDSGRRRHAFAAGLLLGVAAIARPTMLVAAPIALVWVARSGPTRRASRAAALATATSLVVLTVTVRNVVVGHDAVLIASQGGGNFYIGNNRVSNGAIARIPGTRADWWGGFDDWSRIAVAAEGRELRPSEVSSYWYRRGIDFIVHEPAAAARLYARKAVLLFGNGEVSNQEQMYFARDRSRVLSRLPVNFALVISLSALGLARLVRRRCTAGLVMYALAAAYAACIMLFFVSSRHRLPFVAFLLPGAGLGCSVLIDHLRARNWRSLAAAAALVGLVFAASMANPLGVGALAKPRGYYHLAVDYLHDGNVEMARAAIDSSLVCDPGYAPAWAIRGRVRAHAGDPEGAMRDLNIACELNPSFADGFFRRGVVLQRLGRHDEAMKDYERSLELDPDRVEPLNNLADVAFRRGDFERARKLLEQALSVDPAFDNSLYGLGYFYELRGDLVRARIFYRRAGEYAPARWRLQALGAVPPDDEHRDQAMDESPRETLDGQR